MSGRLVPLRDLLDVQNGFAFKSEYFNSEGRGIPLIRIRDIENDNTECHYDGVYQVDYVVNNGEYIIGMDGDFICTRWQGDSALLNQRVCRLRNFSTSVLPEFVFFALQKRLQKIQETTAFVTVKHISSKQILGIHVPLPPLEEQRRIVAVLDRAAEIRRLTEAARTKARAVIPALFLDTFGDPATNSKRWPIVPLGGVIERITGGKNLLAGNGSSSYRIMKVSAVTSGVLRPEESKPAPDGYEPAPEHFVREGDFLFSRANTRELVGAVAVAHKPPEGLLLPDKVWRIEWDHNRIAPAYAYSLLRTSEIRRIFATIASGTSDSMKNISQAKLSRVPIGVPPVTLQAVFAEQVQRIEELSCCLDATAAKAETMAAALWAEVFE